MSDREALDLGQESQSEGREKPEFLLDNVERDVGTGSSASRALLPSPFGVAATQGPDLEKEDRYAGREPPEFPLDDGEEEAGVGSSAPRALLPLRFARDAAPRAEPVNDPQTPRPGRHFLSMLLLVAGIAAAGIFAGGSAWMLTEHSRQAGLLSERAHQTQALTRMIDDLSARLSAVESAKSHDELLELQRSIGEIRSSIASSRELGSALAQLSQRVEKMDREESAKVDKLGEHIDQTESAEVTQFAARIAELEKKTVVAAATAANPASTPQKQSPAPPKLGPNVSMETTGSIDRPRPVLRGYIVLGARDDVALVGGRYGERAVRLGDFLPGAGRVRANPAPGRFMGRPDRARPDPGRRSALLIAKAQSAPS